MSVIGILETKVKLHKAVAIQKKFGSKWCWQCNSDYSPKGRIWVGWNTDVVDVSILKVHSQALLSHFQNNLFYRYVFYCIWV